MTSTNFKDLHHLPASQIDLSKQHSKRQNKNLSQQNMQLRKQNEIMKKQLESINSKLENEVIKKVIEGNRKPRNKQEDVENMQLKNAYKQSDIYKKEAHFYKRKLMILEEREKSQQIGQWRANSLEKENAKLREQMNYLIKINKRQEKGLEAAGLQGYLSNTKETQRLHDQIKKLKQQVQHLQKGDICRQSDSLLFGHRFSTINYKRQKYYNPSRQRIRSETCEQDDMSEVTVLRERIEKDHVRYTMLRQQRDKLREQISRYREEVVQLNKEISSLKEKINALRRNNEVLHGDLHSKKVNTKNNNKSSPRAEFGRRSKVAPQSRIWSISKLEANSSEKLTIKKATLSTSNIYKWSHEIFASKMLQLHLVIHPKGHIQDIHAKYEKGQPKLYNYIRNKSCQSLVCRQGEHIRHISGCFCEGFLQWLKALTSDGRMQTVGKREVNQLDQGGETFEFELEKDGKCGALLGETSDDGVQKLGCLMVRK